jgi:drug/metabolite transporter (DMT)-like permease
MVLGGAVVLLVLLLFEPDWIKLESNKSAIHETLCHGNPIFGLSIVFLHVKGMSRSTLGWTTHLVAWGALCCSAFGPSMLAHVLQQQGQKYVLALEVNIILSIKPVLPHFVPCSC